MAKLFLAHSQFRGEHVVLKQLSLTAGEVDRKRFINEALISLKLTHPNIVRIHDVFESGGELFIEMEWIQGRSLEQLQRASQSVGLPLRIACRVMYDVCQALHAAHHATDAQGRGLGVVHRDIKPANVMVSLGGTTKVIDFGIAWSTSTTIPLVRGEWFTPGYLAPERAREMLRLTAPTDLGDVGEVRASAPPDGRSDQFCAGVMLFELLTGRLPFPPPADVWSSPLSQLAHCRDVARCELDVSTLPPALAPIVAKALAREPEARYRTCQEMADAIKGACALASQEEVALFLDQCFPEAKREVEEVQRLPDASADVLRTLSLGAPPEPGPIVEPPAPVSPSPVRGASGGTTPLTSQGASAQAAGAGLRQRQAPLGGEPPWALAGSLPVEPVSSGSGEKVPPQPRRSGWWALPVIGALAVGGWALRERWAPPTEKDEVADQKQPGTAVEPAPKAPVVTEPPAQPPTPPELQERWTLELPSAAPPVADGRTCLWVMARVQDASGRPVSARMVSFRVVSGEGRLKPAGAQTDDTGTAQVCLTSAVVGPLELAVFDGRSETVAARTVTFVKPPPMAVKPPKLELGVTPGVVVANGGAEAQVTATVTRGDGKPAKDRYILLYTDGGSVNPSAPRGLRLGPTDARGQVTKAFTATKASKVGFSATLEPRGAEQAVASMQDASVEFVAGKPDEKTSSLMARQSSLRAGAETELILQLRDANENPVSGAQVSWSNTESPTNLVSDSRTDERGRATVTFKPRRSGSWRVTVSATSPGDARKIDLSAVVQVEAGEPDPSKSSLSAELAEALADGKSPIKLRLHLRDRFGNPVQRRVALTVTDTAVGTQSTEWLETNGQGDVSHALTSDTAGAKVVTAEVPPETDGPEVRLEKRVEFKAPPPPVTPRKQESATPQVPPAQPAEDSTPTAEAPKQDAGPEVASKVDAPEAPPSEAATPPDAGTEVAAPGPQSP